LKIDYLSFSNKKFPARGNNEINVLLVVVAQLKELAHHC